jgi:hypothetical protein
MAFQASQYGFFFFRANLSVLPPLLLATSLKEARCRLYKRCLARLVEVVFRLEYW